jgi:tRNA (guanine-N7-)-methyltransferase
MKEPVQHPSNDSPQQGARRPVRSYVLRAGRMTDGQKRALEELWPVWGIEVSGGALDLEALFGDTHPVILEIGFGNGEATWRTARDHPEQNFLGVEVHPPGVGHLLLALARESIRNVRVVCHDAVEFLEQCIPDHSLAGVRLFFPDPWPKKRHHKRRIIQPAFMQLLARKLRAGAILHMATDWQPYAEYALEVMNGSAEFENLSQDGRYCERPGWRPRTKYERRGERLGHEVSDLLFRRRPLRGSDERWKPV